MYMYVCIYMYVYIYTDTLMGIMSAPIPKTEGHIMCNAGQPGLCV